MNILLTGDDGYNSIGTRVLIHVLKDKHDLTVVGTKTQQSAVGGKLSIREGGEWGETTVDGVKALWVDGSPGDAMEFSYGYFKEPFDLLISGVNLGENVGIAIVSSGTVCAGIRGLGLGVAKRALTLSWVTPPDFYFHPHNGEDDLSEFILNPGNMIAKTLETVFENELWGAICLNINFPQDHTEFITWTRLAPSIKLCYPPITVDEQTNRFTYPLVEGHNTFEDDRFDITSLRKGNITISPIQPDWTDEKIWKKFTSVEKTVYNK